MVPMLIWNIDEYDYIALQKTLSVYTVIDPVWKSQIYYLYLA